MNSKNPLTLLVTSFLVFLKPNQSRFLAAYFPTYQPTVWVAYWKKRAICIPWRFNVRCWFPTSLTSSYGHSRLPLLRQGLYSETALRITASYDTIESPRSELLLNFLFSEPSRLFFTALRSGDRRSATARTVTRSKRRFRAKTKTNSILALTAPTLAPCPPSLRRVFPRVRR